LNQEGRGTPDRQELQIFISYAREDEQSAQRLYDDLKNAGLSPWLDKQNIYPGQNWEDAINKAIGQSRYFIALFSSASVEKIGYVHSEFKLALDVFTRYPPGKIFYIPVRLDECQIPYRELKSIHHADLFPTHKEWIEGVTRITEVIKQELEESGIGQRNKGKQKKGMETKKVSRGESVIDPSDIYQKIVPKIMQEIDLRRICLSVRTRGNISDLSYEALRGQTLNERIWNLIEICTVKSKLDVLIEVCIAQGIIEEGSTDEFGDTWRRV
jgi:hypothetical protein